jgi:hypothetical protein
MMPCEAGCALVRMSTASHPHLTRTGSHVTRYKLFFEKCHEQTRAHSQKDCKEWQIRADKIGFQDIKWVHGREFEGVLSITKTTYVSGMSLSLCLSFVTLSVTFRTTLAQNETGHTGAFRPLLRQVSSVLLSEGVGVLPANEKYRCVRAAPLSMSLSSSLSIRCRCMSQPWRCTRIPVLMRYV